MASIDELIQLVSTVNEKYNQILELAKKIFELDEISEVDNDGYVIVSTQGLSKKMKLSTLINSVVATYVDKLLFIGEITIIDNNLTIPSGCQWQISNVNYFTSTDFEQEILFTSDTGYVRKDIIVANTLNQLVYIEGVENLGVAVRPNIPQNTVLVTEINVTDIGFDYVVSNEFIKKSEFAENNVTGSGAITLNLNSEQTSFRLASNSITVVEGTIPSSNYINTLGYTGKFLTIINTTASNKTIKHSTDAWCFRFPNNADFVLGPNEVLTMRQTKTTVAYFDMFAVGKIYTGSGGSQDLQQTLENGAEAIDQAIILNQTFDGVADIFKSEHFAGVSVYTLKVHGSSITYQSALAADTISFSDNNEVSKIIPKKDGSGNILSALLIIPETSNPAGEEIATKPYVDTGLSDKVDKVTGKQLSTEDYTTAEKSKLSGIASGATANDTDANLKNRANHTGSQAISTITGLQTFLDGLQRNIIEDVADRSHTGSLSEFIVSNQLISANTLKTGTILELNSRISRTGTNASATIRYYISPNNNSLTGATQIGITTVTNTQSLPKFTRLFSINSSSVLKGLAGSVSSISDEVATTVALLNLSLTLSNNYYLITTVQLNNTADTITQECIYLKSSR